MGEGWGDIFAIMFQMNADTKRDQVFRIGDYVNGAGFRKNPVRRLSHFWNYIKVQSFQNSAPIFSNCKPGFKKTLGING